MKRTVVGVVVTLVAGVALAQGPPEFAARGSLKGAEVPQFYQYQAVFQFAHETLGDPNAEFRTYYIEQVVGIPAGGAAEELFASAVEDAWDAMRAGHQAQVSVSNSGEEEGTTVTEEVQTGIERGDYQSDEAYDAAVERQEREQARALGLILGRLEASLEAEGVSLEGLHRYATERLGSRTSLISSDEIGPDHHIFQVEHSFEVGREVGRRSGGAR